MSDITLSQLIDQLDALPSEIVQLETVLRDTVVSPIVSTVAATKNATLEVEVDKLSMDLFKVEQGANTIAQDIANTVDKIKLFSVIPGIGSYVIPGSGVVLDEFNKFLTEAANFKSSVIAHNQTLLSSAKSYLTQFLTAMNELIAIVPLIGLYSVDGVTVTQILAGLQAVASVL
jgi:hypothetical protein